ncbi:hypothetical protein [Halorussus caseinilyticus]|uniref:Uncharacterized protein n=1 Tax=Halorussus caseinilyticus TaxID=3034025 RepID=A0ABD5WMA8_9EURY
MRHRPDARGRLPAVGPRDSPDSRDSPPIPETRCRLPRTPPIPQNPRLPRRRIERRALSPETPRTDVGFVGRSNPEGLRPDMLFYDTPAESNR